MRSEERLERLLAAWHDESRRPPRGDPRDRARAAMHQARRAAGTAHSRRPWLLLGPRPGPRRALLAGVTMVATAIAVIGVLGWNAPAGSPLFQVRAVRQGIQLALPGSNAAALHLGFAEADLADAGRGENAAPSLQDARNELAAARAVLPSDRTSPLWGRYEDDISSLEADREKIEGEGPTTPGGGATGEPATSEPEQSASPSPPTEPEQTSSGATASPAPEGGGDSEGSSGQRGSGSGSGGDG